MSPFNPIERIGLHQSALIFLGFGWIEREQPISDFGIDMHVEIVNDGIPTGQIFATQIKSGSSYFKEETPTGYIYRGKNEHLEYWLSQSLPVIILIYEPESKTVFWQRVNQSSAIRTEKAWRIEIPKSQLLEKSKHDLLRIYDNPNHYVVMKVGDNSTGVARRVEVSILVESTHAKSRVAMKKMIPEIIEKFKRSDYHRNEITKQRYEGKEAEIVFLFFYESIRQVDGGYTFCRAIWKNESCEYKINPFEADEVVSQIEIKWDNYPAITTLSDANELPKGKYLDLANVLHNTIKELHRDISSNFERYKRDKQFIKLSKFILSKKTEFESLNNNPLERSGAPLECKDLNQLLRESTALMHNIWIVSSDETRDENNIASQINYYLNLTAPKINHYDYELQKLK
ncbi:MAG: DUF4365 domain-containing protein [Cyclobacteriaceae bacterium]|nr:DUF4365 domain-containing protein [Cyclobacteriaceae bacterium]